LRSRSARWLRIGRFLSGWMSEKNHLGRLRTLRGIGDPVSMVARLALFLGAEPLLSTCCSSSSSTATAHSCRVYTASPAISTGRKYLATNYGVLLLAWGFAGVLGPVIGSRVYVSTGTYQYAFFGSAILACGRARPAEPRPPAARCACAGGSLKFEVRKYEYEVRIRSYEYEVRIRSTNTKYEYEGLMSHSDFVPSDFVILIK